MASFELVVRSSEGLCQTVQVTAADALQARSQARLSGWDVLACEPGRRTSGRAGRFGFGAPGVDVVALAHELSSLLAAGLSIPQALQTLVRAAKSGAASLTLQRTADAVAEGLALSAALERHAARFPPLLIATVRASEQTGNLSEALMRYAEHQQRLRALRDKVTSAAVYPALLLALGSLVVVFLLAVVVPKFAVLIESTRQELPWTSRLLMGWGRMVADHTTAMGVLVALGLAAVVAAVRQVRATGGRARWIESLPVVGPLIREFRHAQLFRTTGMLVKGGIPLSRALSLAGSLLGHADSRHLAAAIALLQEGRSFSDALKVTGLADPVTTGMIEVAEHTGSLAEILDRIGQFKELRLQRSVDWASRLIEPVLMIIIGLVIGTIVVLMYLPIFDLASSLQ